MVRTPIGMDRMYQESLSVNARTVIIKYCNVQGLGPRATSAALQALLGEIQWSDLLFLCIRTNVVSDLRFFRCNL